MSEDKKGLFGKRKNKAKKNSKSKKMKVDFGDKGSKKNLIAVGGPLIAVVVIATLIFFVLSSIFSTEEYYVLNTNIKAKQEITPEMVTVRETSKGTGPVNALGMEEIQQGNVYSRYPLSAGDVIAESNAGPLSGQAVGIPDDWVVTSFSTETNDAVGGILGKGDYIDLLGVNDEGARYIFNNLLILEVKFVNEEYDGKGDGETVIGEVMHYTLGMPSDKAAYFHSALNDYDNIKIVKSPHIINYADRDVSNLDKEFKYGPDVGNIDLIEGTDPTFTDVERDEDGRPVEDFFEEEEDEEENENEDYEEEDEEEEDEEEL